MTTLYQWVKENWIDPINKGEHAPNNPWLELRRQQRRLDSLERSIRSPEINHGYSKWTHTGARKATAWTLNWPDYGTGSLYLDGQGRVDQNHFFCYFIFEGKHYVCTNKVPNTADRDYRSIAGPRSTYTGPMVGGAPYGSNTPGTIIIPKGRKGTWFKVTRHNNFQIVDSDIELIVTGGGSWNYIDTHETVPHEPWVVTLSWDPTEYNRLKSEIETQIESLKSSIPTWRESIYQLGLNLKELEDFEAFKRYVANKRVTEEQVAGKIETMDLNTIARHLFLADIEDLKAGFAEALNPEYERASGRLTAEHPMPGLDRYFRDDYLENGAVKIDKDSQSIWGPTSDTIRKDEFWCLRNVPYSQITLPTGQNGAEVTHTRVIALETMLAPSARIWRDYLEWLLRREIIVPERNHYLWLEDQAKAPIIFKRHPDVNDAMANAFAICGHLRKVQLCAAGRGNGLAFGDQVTVAKVLELTVNGLVPDSSGYTKYPGDHSSQARWDDLFLGYKKDWNNTYFDVLDRRYQSGTFGTSTMDREWNWGLGIVNNGQLVSYDCKPVWTNNEGTYEVKGTVIENDSGIALERRLTGLLNGEGIYPREYMLDDDDMEVNSDDFWRYGIGPVHGGSPLPPLRRLRSLTYLYWNGLSSSPAYPDKHLKPKTGGLLLGDDEDTEELIKRFNVVLGNKGRAVRKTLPVGLGERRGTESSTGVAYQHDIDFGVRYRIRIELTDKTMDISDIYRLYLELAKFNREYLLSGFMDIRNSTGWLF